MKSPLHLIGSAIALIVLMSSALSGQQLKLPESPDPWLIRSQTITESLLRDAPALSAFDRAILFARLGDTWWQDDQKRAPAWLEKAIETVEYIPDQSPDDHSRRLATARIILSIIARRDEKLGRRLTDMIASSSEHDSNEERSKNADALVEEALAIVDRDPQRAALLGAESLRVGRPTLLSGLLWRLRSRDPKLADALFAQAIAVVQESYDGYLFPSLLRVAFPTLIDEPSLPVPPDQLRAQLLLAAAAHVRSVMISSDSQGALCSSTAGLIYLIAPLLPEFDRLLPLEESSTVRQLMAGCQPRLSPFMQQAVEDGQRKIPLKTVDDFLDAADKAKDAKAKTVLEVRAAQLAVQHQDFERAIKIIDGMDDDARKFIGETWEAWRFEWATAAALDHLKHDDLMGLHRTIAAVPSGLRAGAQIGVAYELPVEENNRSLVLELIQTGRQELSRSDMSVIQREGYSLTLLILYAKFLPADSFAVLRETVAALNLKATGESSYFNGRELVEPETGYHLPVSMLQSDEFSFLDAISAVESPTKRARIRIELLIASLEQYRTSQKRRKPPANKNRVEIEK